MVGYYEKETADMSDIYGVPYTYWPLDTTSNRPQLEFPAGKAEWITVHETDNWDDGATAEATARYLHNGSGGRQASWHDSVDNLEIYQCLRDWEQGWHAADGGGPGNTRSWGLEICVNLDGAARVQAIHNAAKRVAWLLNNGHGWRGVRQHNHWSGKHCPRGIREGHPMNWTAFMGLVVRYRQPEQNLEGDLNEEQIQELVRTETEALYEKVDMLQARVDRINEVFIDYRFPLMREGFEKLMEAVATNVPPKSES